MLIGEKFDDLEDEFEGADGREFPLFVKELLDLGAKSSVQTAERLRMTEDRGARVVIKLNVEANNYVGFGTVFIAFMLESEAKATEIQV